MSKFRYLPYAVLAAGSLLVGGSAYAQSMYGIDERQDRQWNRVEQGIRGGQITQGEAARLRQGELAIDRAQARARADGEVSARERARIDQMTDRQGRQIYRQSHDRQQSWDRGQNWGRTDRQRDGWNDRRYGQNAWGHDGRHRAGNNHDWNRHDNRGWGNNHADRRDWGRSHNNGSWNHGRDHNGWNRGDHNAWNGSRNHGWNGNRDGNRGSNGGTATTSHTRNWAGQRAATQPATTSHTRNWAGQRAATQPATTSHTRNWGGQRAATQPATTSRSWGGQTRMVSSAPATRSHSAGGARGFGNGGGRR